jgi:hypothetical protein
MVLTAITEAEVAGSRQSSCQISKCDVVIREAKKRREAEAAYAVQVAPGSPRKSVRSPTYWHTTCRNS